MSDQHNNAPISKIRDGRISADIWERNGERGKWYDVTFSRTYTDAQGNPKSSHSFSGTDLLKIGQLAERAYNQTRELAQGQSARQGPDVSAAREDMRQGGHGQSNGQAQGYGHEQ